MCAYKTAQSVTRVALFTTFIFWALTTSYVLAQSFMSDESIKTIGAGSDFKMIFWAQIIVSALAFSLVAVVQRSASAQGSRHERELSNTHSRYADELEKNRQLVRDITERHSKALEKAVIAQCPIHSRIEIEQVIRDMESKMEADE